MGGNVFDFKTDFRVQVGIPTNGVFILGQSVLDGTDVLADSTTGAITWVDVLAEVNNINISVGANVNSGLLMQSVPSTASIQMQSATYDPSQNPAIHAGTPIRVQYRPGLDPDRTLWFNRFIGKIKSYSVSYDFFGNNTIDFECVDLMQDWVNTSLPGFTSAAGQTFEQISNVLVGYFPGSSSTSPGWSKFGAYSAVDTTVGTVLNEILDGELGFASITPATELLEIDNYDTIVSKKDGPLVMSFSNIHNTDPAAKHVCMTDLVIEANTDETANEIIVNLIPTGATYTTRNTDSADLYGKVALTTDLMLQNSTYVNSWFDKINLQTKIRKVKSVSFNPIDDDGLIRSVFRQLTKSFMAKVLVEFETDNIFFAEVYLTTRMTETITPTTWDVSLELWKGF